jgi:Winged helix-turn-helix DNA-binding
MSDRGATAFGERPRATTRTPDRETDAEAARTTRREHRAVTTIERPTVDQRILATLSEDTGRIPVVTGPCGAGRTSLLHRLHADLGPLDSQYVNVERTATTPERFFGALTAASPFVESRPSAAVLTPREAFDAVLAFLAGARGADHDPVTFLLDEFLEFRTFENFPGLRRAIPELLAVVASSPNRFVLTSRYSARMERALAGASPQFVVVPMPALSGDELKRMLAGALAAGPASDANDAATESVVDLVASLSGGRPAYARVITDAMAARVHIDGATDPVAALAAQMEPDAALYARCAFSYELRLHRARGYGALKAILEILAEEEPLTLTEIAVRLGRTPGSTKDYLSWLEDVDLVWVHHKRYGFRDQLLRVWARLHCRSTPPTTEAIGREIQRYAGLCTSSVPAGERT